MTDREARLLVALLQAKHDLAKERHATLEETSSRGYEGGIRALEQHRANAFGQLTMAAEVLAVVRDAADMPPPHFDSGPDFSAGDLPPS